MGQEQSSTVNSSQEPNKTCRPCGNWGQKDYNTVKVDAAALGALGKENAAHPNVMKDAGEKASMVNKEEQERARQRQETEAKQEELRRAEESRKEMERRVRDEQERQQAELRRREAERRRLQLEQESRELLERQQHEKELQQKRQQDEIQEAERLAKQQEIEDQKKVREWLQANGFKEVNDLVRKKLSKVAPLQVAIQQNNAEMLKLLLASGADSSKVNGKNESALTVAQKMDKKGSHAAVLLVLQTLATYKGYSK